jgi:transposase
LGNALTRNEVSQLSATLTQPVRLCGTHARSPYGTRVYHLKPFYAWCVRHSYWSSKPKTSFSSNDFKWLNGWRCRAFEVFIEKCLISQLWSGAVVVMDNLPAYKIAVIEPLIQSVGARVLNLSSYSPDFNPIEHWWSQLKAFLRPFSPTTTKMVDTLIATARLFSRSSTFMTLVYKLLLLYFINLQSAVIFHFGCLCRIF